MRKVLCYFSAAALALGAMAGCGGSSNNSTNSNEVPVVVTVHDAPPTGVTVVSFSVQVTGITLQGSGSSNVSLLSSPVTVQLQNLGTTSEILAQSSAPAGTYSNTMITYSSPSMTFQNSSGSTQTVGTTSCTIGSFCSVTPTLNQMSTTVTTSPFPITLTKGLPVNIAIDFNIGSSIQSNLTVSPAISVTASTTPLADTNLADITGITESDHQCGFEQLQYHRYQHRPEVYGKHGHDHAIPGVFFLHRRQFHMPEQQSNCNREPGRFGH